MKRTLTKHLSLRCKFKDEHSVELTVVNHDTGATYQILWTFDTECACENVQATMNTEQQESEAEEDGK